MMLWHGESHLTIFWSVKVSSLVDLLLSVLSVHPRNSFLLGYHLELSSAFLRSIQDIFFLQVPQIYLEIDLRWMAVAEIRRLIGAASVDWVIPACSYSFTKPALAGGFSSDHILGLYLKKTKRGRWVPSLSPSLSSLSLLY